MIKRHILTILTLISIATNAQNYDHRAAFNPQFYPYPGNPVRSSSGEPGPAYWQNRADYSIQCKLDTATHVVSGEVTMTFTNNSPDALRFLWPMVPLPMGIPSATCGRNRIYSNTR